MAEKKYRIKVQNRLIEVTKEVYLVYYRMRRQERAQRERDAYNHTIQYSSLDREEILGEDMLPDLFSPQVEEQAIADIQIEKLQSCIKRLSTGEKKLIFDFYFMERSERQVAQEMGLSNMAVHYRKVNVLRKLKKMMDK